MWNPHSQLPAVSQEKAPTLPHRGKVLSVFGAWPEVVQFSLVLDELDRRPGLQTVNLCTSRAFAQSTAVPVEFRVSIDYELDAIQPNQPANTVLGRLLSQLDLILEAEQPNLVLVQGDSISALAGAMAAFNRQIRVGHIESANQAGAVGTETKNALLIRQIAAARLSAPVRPERSPDQRENRPTAAASPIFMSGNPAADTLSQMTPSTGMSPLVQHLLRVTTGAKRMVLSAQNLNRFGCDLAANFDTIREFLLCHPTVSLIFPVQPSAPVRQLANDFFGDLPNAHLVPPLSYPDFVRLLQHAWLILSDSAAIREKGPGFGKPTLLMQPGESPQTLARRLAQSFANGWVKNRENPAGPASGTNIADAVCELIG